MRARVNPGQPIRGAYGAFDPGDEIVGGEDMPEEVLRAIIEIGHAAPLPDAPAKETGRAEPAAEVRSEPEPEGEEQPRWHLTKYTPAEYLERYPDGPNAELAAALVGADE